MTDHDPFNEPDTAHPRARELMRENFFWDCVDEEGPFGSDEGHDAYFDYRGWRSGHPSAPLVDCLSKVMKGELAGYTSDLASAGRVEADITSPGGAFLADNYDMLTLDTTVIATGLGQLLDEGHIDADAKPYIHVALSRQLHPRLATNDHRRDVLRAIKRVLELA